MKKVLAIILALVLSLSMGLNVYAATLTGVGEIDWENTAIEDQDDFLVATDLGFNFVLDPYGIRDLEVGEVITDPTSDFELEFGGNEALSLISLNSYDTLLSITATGEVGEDTDSDEKDTVEFVKTKAEMEANNGAGNPVPTVFVQVVSNTKAINTETDISSDEAFSGTVGRAIETGSGTRLEYVFEAADYVNMISDVYEVGGRTFVDLEQVTAENEVGDGTAIYLQGFASHKGNWAEYAPTINKDADTSEDKNDRSKWTLNDPEKELKITVTYDVSKIDWTTAEFYGEDTIGTYVNYATYKAENANADAYALIAKERIVGGNDIPSVSNSEPITASIAGYNAEFVPAGWTNGTSDASTYAGAAVSGPAGAVNVPF
ncbi:MAG: hypothetical protein LBR54_02400, partial [Oscillospiraceae bacterium]|nr:hypothetical protein [Oscillospiraceae bacterium]